MFLFGKLKVQIHCRHVEEEFKEQEIVVHSNDYIRVSQTSVNWDPSKILVILISSWQRCVIHAVTSTFIWA